MSFSEGKVLAVNITFVPCDNSSLANGNMPNIKSTPALSKNITHVLYGCF